MSKRHLPNDQKTVTKCQVDICQISSGNLPNVQQTGFLTDCWIFGGPACINPEKRIFKSKTYGFENPGPLDFESKTSGFEIQRSWISNHQLKL
jgi:hypothetical protein